MYSQPACANCREPQRRCTPCSCHAKIWNKARPEDPVHHIQLCRLQNLPPCTSPNSAAAADAIHTCWSTHADSIKHAAIVLQAVQFCHAPHRTKSPAQPAPKTQPQRRCCPALPSNMHACMQPGERPDVHRSQLRHGPPHVVQLFYYKHTSTNALTSCVVTFSSRSYRHHNPCMVCSAVLYTCVAVVLQGTEAAAPSPRGQHPYAPSKPNHAPKPTLMLLYPRPHTRHQQQPIAPPAAF